MKFSSLEFKWFSEAFKLKWFHEVCQEPTTGHNLPARDGQDIGSSNERAPSQCHYKNGQRRSGTSQKCAGNNIWHRFWRHRRCFSWVCFGCRDGWWPMDYGWWGNFTTLEHWPCNMPKLHKLCFTKHESMNTWCVRSCTHVLLPSLAMPIWNPVRCRGLFWVCMPFFAWMMPYAHCTSHFFCTHIVSMSFCEVHPHLSWKK